MNRFKLLVTIVFMTLYANTVLADADVVARVNGKPLTEFELNEEFQQLLPMMGSYHGGVTPERIAEIREKALNTVIEKELQYQYALDKGLSVPKKDIESELSAMEKRFSSSAEFKAAMKSSNITKGKLRELIKKTLLVAKVKKQEITSNAALSESELRDYYEKNKSNYLRPVEFKASHILIGVDPAATNEEKKQKLKRAKEVLAKAKSGEDFYNLAMTYSTDEGSAPVGGNLGTFHKGMAEEPFEKAVLSLKVGEISDVVETLYGYHIIMLTGMKPETQLSFNDVIVDLKNKLEKIREEKLYKDWMDGLKAKAKIEIVKK